jgi:hypothetical protein
MRNVSLSVAFFWAHTSARSANESSCSPVGFFAPNESLENHTYKYILEDKQTGYLRALPSKKEKLLESLADFFPEKYIAKYEEVKGKIKYKSIPALVELYNSK